MNDLPRLRPSKAYQVRDGHAAVLVRDGTAMICMKVVRKGKDYIHHYLLPLDPVPDDGPGLIYLDPEDDVLDSRANVAFNVADTPIEPGKVARIEAGDVLLNADGPFLKVRDHPRTERPFAYLHLQSAQIKYRQERKVVAIYRDWHAELEGDDGTIPFAELRKAIPD
jgi:hypothetical protein